MPDPTETGSTPFDDVAKNPPPAVPLHVEEEYGDETLKPNNSNPGDGCDCG